VVTIEDTLSRSVAAREWYGSLPDGWETAALGWISQLLVPMRDKPADLSGPIPWIRIEDFEGQYISKSKSGQGVSEETVREMHLKVMPPGTVLCSCSCSMGATAITAVPLVSNLTFIGIMPAKRLDSRYTCFLMQSAASHR